MQKLKMEELRRADLATFQQQEKLPFAVILEDVRSGLNVGSVFRTADAFAIEQIFLTGITAQPPHREILKTALGSTDSVQWSHAEAIVPLIEQLKESGWRVFAVEQALPRIWLQELVWQPSDPKIAFIFGNEVEGVSGETLALCDGCVEVPQFGTKHSLNVAVTAGIVLWEMARQWMKQEKPTF